MFRPYRIKRRDAESMEELMKKFIRQRGLTPGINCQTVFRAWDKVSGAAAYTIRRFYRDGVLYCAISSSVIRSQLHFRKDEILLALNAELGADPVYDPAGGFVKKIVLR